MINSKQPAFPLHPDTGVVDVTTERLGLTKREYFTALAMQGMLANPELIKTLQESEMNPDRHAEFLAVAAVEQADELLKQLDK